MTRATLLHVLERPTALGPAEVRELEQLAQAFPYCQTAHLLLAKAAHDQGTMLAGQRLRRAATYAADRTLLRRLIEQEEPAEPAAAAEPLAPPHPLDLVDWPDEYVPPVATPPAGPARFVPSAPPAPAALAPIAEALTPPTEPTAETPPAAAALTVPAAAETIPAPIAAVVDAAPASPAVVAPLVVPAAEALPASGEPTETIVDVPVEAAEVVAPEASAAAEAAAMAATVEEPEIPATAEMVALAPLSSGNAGLAENPPLAAPAPTATELPTTTETETIAAQTPEATAPPETELPPQAPAIRPPVEVGEARFEFGLADPAPVAPVPTYELPGLVDEWAASAVTRSLGSPETPAAPLPPPVAPVFTPAAFTGDAVVGYAFGESSRLGLSMQLLDLLAAKAEAAESTTAVVAAAQPPAAPLPPAGTFFEPDPLLLDHWATHRPVPPELPSTVDLINNFLKRQPRLTRPAMLPPAPGGQADLSVRSTRAEPDLVSENLARIFVRQGKTARAIEIYEKLMVKQPEKMAYFALQIQSLQPSA